MDKDNVSFPEKRMQRETLMKVRCYNCGKVYDKGMEEEYKLLQAINQIFKEIDTDKILKEYNDKEIRRFILRILSLFDGKHLNYTLSKRLLKLKEASEKTKEDVRKILFEIVDDYKFEAFDILKETEPGKELEVYKNNLERFLKEEIGLRKDCCKLHFQTPYMISEGLTNQITVPGLRNRFTEIRPVKKNVEDPLNIFEGNLAEPQRRKVTRAKKDKDLFINPEMASKIPSTGKTEEQLHREKEQKEMELRKIAREDLMNMRDFIEGEFDLPLETPEETAKASEVPFEPLPYETPAVEKGEGRLKIPIEKKELFVRKGRGRPKKTE